MNLLDQTRADRLVHLARECFNPELSETELEILRNSSGSGDSPGTNEIGPLAKVSAELVRWLATDPQTLPFIDQRGIRVAGATFADKLNLWNCRVHSHLRLMHCTFHAEVYLRSAETRGVDFSDSSFDKGISAAQLVAHGSLRLSRVRSSARLELIGAQVEGDLDCSGAKLAPTKNDSPDLAKHFAGVAFTADRATIGGAVLMHEGFESSGEVRMVNTSIRSDLICYGAKFTTSKCALSMWRAEIGGAVYFERGFESSGTVSLSNAKVEGMVSCSGMKVTVSGAASGAGCCPVANVSPENASDCTALDLNGATIGDWSSWGISSPQGSSR
jgi:hypothetical protein